MKKEFLTVLSDDISCADARALCAEKAERLLGVKFSGEAPSVLDMSAASEKDMSAAAERGLHIHMVCRGMLSDDGFIAYAEPEMFSEQPKSVESDASETEGVSMESDNSLHIRRYYIRFSGDSGGWLDIVTRERWGDGVLTMPVSTKAVHNWARHARRIDPNVFVAGIA